MLDDNRKIEIQDELSKIQIDQLHKATMTFSSQSFEVKKFCIVAITTVSTIILGAGKSVLAVCFSIIIITLLFYTLDAFTYYYQRVLRKRMIEEENAIYTRNAISDMRSALDATSWGNAFFNKSHFMYYTISIIFIALFLYLVCLERSG